MRRLCILHSGRQTSNHVHRKESTDGQRAKVTTVRNPSKTPTDRLMQWLDCGKGLPVSWPTDGTKRWRYMHPIVTAAGCMQQTTNTGNAKLWWRFTWFSGYAELINHASPSRSGTGSLQLSLLLFDWLRSYRDSFPVGFLMTSGNRFSHLLFDMRVKNDSSMKI